MGTLFAQQEYILDNHQSNAYFKSHSDLLFLMDDEVIGVNEKLTGTLHTNNEHIQGKIIIDSSAFNTQNEKRDSHIKEILNHQQFNNIIITIHQETMKDNKRYLEGDLFINGVTQTVNIPVKKKQENNVLIYTGKIKVKYSDFNIEPPTLAGFIKQAKDSIEIGAKVTFVRTK